jgi:arylsulfatase A-like enzyme
MPRGAVGERFTLDLVRALQGGHTRLTDEEVAYATALYDGDLLNADRHVGAFVAYLDELGLSRDTLVVVTSDHGEELNDHFPQHTGDHGHALYDNLLLVPLVVHDPTRRYPVTEVRAQVQTLDVLPTVAALLGVPIDGAVEGRSLVPLMEGGSMDEHPAVAGWTAAGPQRLGLRFRGFKYAEVVGPGPPERPLSPSPPLRELYDLAHDPRERENLFLRRPPLAAEMQRILAGEREAWRRVGQIPAAEGVDEKLQERLRALGYIR